jgi:hypothetical protein
MTRLIISITLLLVAVTAAFADIARPTDTPKPKPEKMWNGQMRIDTRSTNVGVATLTISKDKLKQLRAALDDADTDDSNSAAVSGGLSRTQTIVAGLLLSLGLVIGGSVAFKKNSRSTRIAASIAIVSLGALGAVAVFANVPPPRLTSLTSSIFDKNTKTYGYAEGQVVIKVVNNNPRYGSPDVLLEVPATEEDK